MKAPYFLIPALLVALSPLCADAPAAKPASTAAQPATDEDGDEVVTPNNQPRPATKMTSSVTASTPATPKPATDADADAEAPAGDAKAAKRA